MALRICREIELVGDMCVCVCVCVYASGLTAQGLREYVGALRGFLVKGQDFLVSLIKSGFQV